MPNTGPKKLVQVAVGVVKDASGNILISLRDKALHQGGLWEFPGGKLEAGETAEQALVRELKEELNVTVKAATPLITIKHHYPDKRVQLNVFLVDQFEGPVTSCEGQPFAWVEIGKLPDYAFPKANQAIINALRLPDRYAILDDSGSLALMAKLEYMLSRGIKLIQARLKQSSPGQIQTFMEHGYALCQKHQALLLVNSAVTNAAFLCADGLHLTSQDLMALEARPEGIAWMAASCHNHHELKQAQLIGVDFVVLSPVLATPSHPDAYVLGWKRFTEAVADVAVPVYALGGMTEAHLNTAKAAGAQGIAGISTFLCD